MANKVILSTNNGEQIILQGNGPKTIRLQGTSVLPNEYTAGEGLILTGKQFSVDTDIVAEKTDIGNGTLTIQKNGAEVGTFDANSAENTTVNITVPTDNTQLINGMGYQRASDVQDAITGKANVDLDNLSAIGNAKFTNMMLKDASNADPRLATYAELMEIKKLMLGKIDWSNAITGTISLVSSQPTEKFTCPSDGYIKAPYGNTANFEVQVNGVKAITTVSTEGTATLGELVSVSEGDIVSVIGSGTRSYTVKFLPQKDN